MLADPATDIVNRGAILWCTAPNAKGPDGISVIFFHFYFQARRLQGRYQSRAGSAPGGISPGRDQPWAGSALGGGSEGFEHQNQLGQQRQGAQKRHQHGHTGEKTEIN